MSMFRQIWPGARVQAAGILALLCLALPAFSAEAGGSASNAYSYAELLLDDLRSVPKFELGPKQYLLVIGSFEKVNEKHPKHPKADRGLFVTAELYEELSKLSKDSAHKEKAVAAYRTLAARFPESPYGAKALVSLRGLGVATPKEAAPEKQAPQVAEAKKPAAPAAEAAPPATLVEDQITGSIARPANFTAAGGSTMVRTIRHWSHKDYTRIVIEVDDATDIRFDRAKGPDRLFFDFLHSRLDGPLHPIHAIEVGDGRVNRIRTGQFKRDISRVVFDLDFPAHFTSSWLANPTRFVVDLRREPPPVLAENPPPAPEPAPEPIAPAEEPPAEPEMVAAAAAVEEVMAPPSDALARPILEESTLAADLANEPLEPSDPGGRPSVTSEEIIPAFLEERAKPSPLRERYEQARTEPSTPSKQAVGAGTSPDVRDTPAAQRAVDLRTREEQVVLAKLEAPSAPVVREVAPPADNLPPPKPAKLSSSGQSNLIRSLGLKVGKVVIDPGHGGHDTGTIGAGKLREKDLVNDIAQRLGKLITERLGSEVIYTRSDDTFVPLHERPRIANQAEADLFISIHANSARQRTVRGIETFYLSLTTDSWAMAVAARENAASEHSVHELENLVAKITRNENITESREFAAKVQSALHEDLSKQSSTIRNRGVRKAPFLALMGAKMPAILAEVSFLSNATDEKLLKTSDYRDKVAEALYKGIAAYADTLSSITVTEKNATTAGMD